jgi:hypothetical protein
VYGVAASSVYAGLATINTIQSMIDLMIKVAITILVVLVVMMIFLFFVLWPFMPLILSVVLLIGGTAFGGAVGGMADTFCFAAGTRIQTADGDSVCIEDVRVGAKLRTGDVQGIMKFQQHAYDMYELYGVQVSGTHIVYTADGPIHVRNHPDAVLLASGAVELYCLITSSHTIPVLSNNGPLVFADWEEIETADELRQWHRHVFTTLNGDASAAYVEPSTVALASEAVLTGPTRVWTPLGPVSIRGISPGTFGLDAAGKPTRVTGVVCVANNQVAGARALNACGAYISAGAWVQRHHDAATWTQPEPDSAAAPLSDDVLWYSLFTESGTFRLCEDTEIGTNVRDFSDVGADNLAQTYGWVLRALERGTK